MADPVSWSKFSVEWQECLDMRPQMKSLHMTDLMFRESDEAKERAARFYRIICDHIKSVVVITVPLNHYREVFAEAHPLFKNPYFFVFFLFIRHCRRHHPGTEENPEIQFIFDEQSGVTRKLAEGWDYYRQNYPEIAAFLGEFPAFMNDEEVLPLQASDFMAWMYRRALSDAADGKPQMVVPWDFRDEIAYHWAKYDRDMLQAEYAVMTGI